MLDQRISQLGQKKTYPTKKVIFNSGDPALGFYYIESGEVRIYKMDRQGKEIEVNRLEVGDFFGEAIVFTNNTFSVFAETVKKSNILYFSKTVIEGAIANQPRLSIFFIKLLANKCLALNQRLESLTLETVEQRLARFLAGSCSGKNKCLIKLTISKSELAKRLGTISATLSRNLQQLQKERIIEVSGKIIKILDCNKLHELNSQK